MIVCWLLLLLISNALSSRQEKPVLNSATMMAITGFCFFSWIFYNIAQTTSSFETLIIFAEIILTICKALIIPTIVVISSSKLLSVFLMLLSLMRTKYKKFISYIISLHVNRKIYYYGTYVCLVIIPCKIFLKWVLFFLECNWIYPLVVGIIVIPTIFITNELWGRKHLFFHYLSCFLVTILVSFILLWCITNHLFFIFYISQALYLMILSTWFGEYVVLIGGWNYGSFGGNNGNNPLRPGNNNRPPRDSSHLVGNHQPQDGERRPRDGQWRPLDHLFSLFRHERVLPLPQVSNSVGTEGPQRRENLFPSSRENVINTGYEMIDITSRTQNVQRLPPGRSNNMVLPTMRTTPDIIHNNPIVAPVWNNIYTSVSVLSGIVVPGGQDSINAINRVTGGFYDGIILLFRAFSLVDVFVICIDNIDDLVVGDNGPVLSRGQLSQLKRDTSLLKAQLRTIQPLRNGPLTPNSMTQQDKAYLISQLDKHLTIINRRLEGREELTNIYKRSFLTPRWDSPSVQTSMRKDD